ncbi:hypothetical protein EMCRGX_G026370 [Ephydatia muelleri]
MPRLFKRKQSYNVAKNSFVAKIYLLDNTTVDFNLLPEVTGRDCLEKVAQCLDIQEIQYFGLQYRTKEERFEWVDRDKPLRKQLEKYSISSARNAELQFGVQFYTTDVTTLKFEITRYLYFLQLKHLILNGHLLCPQDMAVRLASYALQAEFGDYDESKHTPQFLNNYVILPSNIGPVTVVESLTAKASKLHQKHQGMSPAQAELTYIKLAQQLPEYGHEVFQKLEASDGGTTCIWLGACFIGIFVKHSNGQPTVYFKWAEIIRMKVRNKNFGVETCSETVYFKLPDHLTAQYLLRMMIGQHMFYQAELIGTSGAHWTQGFEGAKRKSHSLHDVRTNSAKQDGMVSPGDRKHHSGRPILMRGHQDHREGAASMSPVSLSSTAGTQQSSPTTLPTEKGAQAMRGSPSRSYTHSPQVSPYRKILSEESASGLSPEQLPGASTSKSSPRMGGGDAPSQRSNSDQATPTHHMGEEYSSQESFDMTKQGMMKKSAASLDRCSAKPARDSSTQEQSTDRDEENGAYSSKCDSRVHHLEEIMLSGTLFGEFDAIPKRKSDGDIGTGQKPENVHKNRYKDILPYEENRVLLNPDNNTAHCDYINASIIEFDVAEQLHKFIIAQGPLQHTCADFWQMEEGQSKCHRYFPPDDQQDAHVQFEQYRITLKFVAQNSVTTRCFSLRHIPSNQVREITHLQYSEWPDHGIPEDPQPFLDFVGTVHSLRQQYHSGVPVLVHCSAGVGRSGVFVLMDLLMAKVDCGDEIDVAKSLQLLRDQRMNLVQMEVWQCPDGSTANGGPHH